MNENPYSSMIMMMKEQGETQDDVMVGTVLSSSPLKVEIGDLQIDKDNILVADYLLKGHKRKVSLKGDMSFDRSSASGSTGSADGHTHPILNVGVNKAPVTIDSSSDYSYIETEDALGQGDKLAILRTSDSQLYIIVARLSEV